MKESDHTDKALRKAIEELPKYSLPSNFTYRVMQSIEKESHLREVRTEKRTFILWVLTLAMMLAIGLAYVICYYGEEVRQAFFISRMQPFFVPLMMTMPLLMLFNKWLRQKFSQK